MSTNVNVKKMVQRVDQGKKNSSTNLELIILTTKGRCNIKLSIPWGVPFHDLPISPITFLYYPIQIVKIFLHNVETLVDFSHYFGFFVLLNQHPTL